MRASHEGIFVMACHGGFRLRLIWEYCVPLCVHLRHWERAAAATLGTCDWESVLPPVTALTAGFHFTITTGFYVRVG